MAETPSLTRYDVYGFDDHGNETIRALPDETGDWCRYSDVAPILERCKRLEAEVYECIKDLVVTQGNIFAEVRCSTDPNCAGRWEGVYDHLQAQIDRARVTLSEEPSE